MLLFSLLFSNDVAAKEPEQVSVHSFETLGDLQAVVANHGKIIRQSDYATAGRQALRIDFLPAEWPNCTFRAPAEGWNWQQSAALAVDVTNPTDARIAFSIRIDDDPRADGSKYCLTGSGHAYPGRGPTTFLLSLGSADPMDFGMRGLPGYTGTILPGHGEIDTSHITSFQIFLHSPEVPTALVIDNLRLLPAPSLVGIVDRFGQFTGQDWPGKISSDTELAEQLVLEQAELAKSPQLPDRDSYGGWASGPKLEATGFFRTEKHRGKWWLVTPEGRLFFSLGVDCVGTYNATIIEKRESMFTWLPAEDDPLARNYRTFDGVHRGPVTRGRTFDFYQANLQRKYGQDFKRSWDVHAASRLRAWGFNTIGNWSDRSLFGLQSVPFTVPLQVGGSHARLSSGSDYWAKMHDPFDPQFAVDADKSFQVAKQFVDDPWCLGYFVDNELSWGNGTRDRSRYGLATHALAAEAEQPAKKVFVQDLRQQYKTIEKFNKAWQTQVVNWHALTNEPFEFPDLFATAMRADCARFTKRFAKQYFRVVRDTLAKHDPNHLYLGCRFSTQTSEVLAAAVEVCPVISFNIYDTSLALPQWDFTRDLDVPCMIGEFHFGALDRGMFHTGLVGADNQADRAASYQTYVRAVIDHPAFVGCHWFQFVDQPLTGRVQDGENYNIGFLTVADSPHTELVEAAKAVHAEVYRRRIAEE